MGVTNYSNRKQFESASRPYCFCIFCLFLNFMAHVTKTAKDRKYPVHIKLEWFVSERIWYRTNYITSLKMSELRYFNIFTLYFRAAISTCFKDVSFKLSILILLRVVSQVISKLIWLFCILKKMRCPKHLSKSSCNLRKAQLRFFCFNVWQLTLRHIVVIIY